MRHTACSTRRRGFTLIELLVVIAIIMALAALGIYIQPSVTARQNAARGATQLQGALLTAKSRATRDRMPTGIRLTMNGGFCSDPQFIQQPDDFSSVPVKADPGTTVTFQGVVDLFGNPIMAGDYLEIGGSGLPHQITAIGGATLTLASPLTNAVAETKQYRIMRSPRLLLGEPPVKLPQDVGVDMDPNNDRSVAIMGGANTRLSGTADILFAPSGQVVGQFMGYDMIICWVRDTRVAGAFQAFPSLIVIYPKTGGIMHHDVSQDPVQGPYEFAKNARSSGL